MGDSSPPSPGRSLRCPVLRTPINVSMGLSTEQLCIGGFGAAYCGSLVTRNCLGSYTGYTQVTLSHPKPLVELLWNHLPKSQGRIQGSNTISIEFTISFSVEILFCFCCFLKPIPHHASEGHISSFLDHYSEVLQLYSSQSGLGLLGLNFVCIL